MADDKPQSPDGTQPTNMPPKPELIPAVPSPRLPVSAPAQAAPKMHAPPPAAGTQIAAGRPGPGDMKDGSREVIETVVFVVVLVLLLKTFLAEAFVIPTGSMATTLLGYHQDVTCDMCGYRFLVNASAETEDNFRDNFRQFVTKAYCPNCRHLNTLRRQLPDGELP